MIYFSLLFLLMVIYQAFSYSIKMENSVKVIAIFIIFAFVYYLGIPIEMLIKGTSLGTYNQFYSDRVQLIIVSMGILSIVGFSLGYFISGFRFKEIESTESNSLNPFEVSIVALVLLSGLLLFGLFNDSIINSSSSYFGNYTETYSNPLYAFLKEIFTYSLAVLISILGSGKRNRKIVASALSAILISFGIITSDKDPILLAVLGWGIPFFYWLTVLGLQKIKIYFGFFILSVIIIPLLSLMFSLNRSGVLKEYSNQIERNGLYTYFDAAGPYLSLVEVLENPNVEFEYGRTYYWGFIGWIPKAIWPNRPLDQSEVYAREKIKNWEPGRGLGYSLMTEAYKNFGVPGALIQYFLIGLLIGYIGKLHLWIFRHQGALNLLFIWLSYNLVIMHRGAFNLPSTYIRCLLPFFLCYWGISIIYKVYFKWRAKSA